MSERQAPLSVDGARLLARLDELSAVGRTADGGVNRVAYGDADLAGRELVRRWMREAGLEPRIDAAGNTIARRIGDPATGPAFAIGSHSDSVPNGGRFDGALGVLAAIEAARTIAERGLAMRHPLEVIDFQNEEGGLVGSRAMAGLLGAESLGLTSASGFSLAEGIRRLGGRPEALDSAARAAGELAGYLELHIEQGRVLERAGADIGIVEGIVGIRYWEVTIDGVASHSGTTPMADRHDALLAAARFIDVVHGVVTAESGRQVGTVGRMRVSPGAPNVIAGQVVLTLELRDLDAGRIDALFERVAEQGERIARESGTAICFEATHVNAPSPTDPRLRGAIAEAASDLGLRAIAMPSGAGHDAQNMARLGPSAMLFVPSVEGLSHSPRESTRERDVVNGANVLLGALLRADGEALG